MAHKNAVLGFSDSVVEHNHRFEELEGRKKALAVQAKHTAQYHDVARYEDRVSAMGMDPSTLQSTDLLNFTALMMKGLNIPLDNN